MTKFDENEVVKIDESTQELNGMFGMIVDAAENGYSEGDGESMYTVSVSPLGTFIIPESAISAVKEPCYLVKFDDGREAWLPESYLEPAEE